MVKCVLGLQSHSVAAEMIGYWEFSCMMCIVILREQSDANMILLVDGINFTVTLIFLNTTLVISNISFTATPAAD